MTSPAAPSPVLTAAEADRLQRFVAYLVARGGMLENVEGQPVRRATPIEVLECLLYLDVAWRNHPQFYPAFPPPAISVWSHEAYQGHTESYGIGALTDVTSPAHLKWGTRTLGEFAGVRPLPPDIPFHPEREAFISWSLKGSGKSFRARLELKRLLPEQYRGLVAQARTIARETKEIAYKGWTGERPSRSDPAYRRINADEVRYQEFLYLFGARLAGIEHYIDPRDFWACAVGQVHPEQVAHRFKQMVLL